MKLSHLPGSPHLTYCTNIHAGESWHDIARSLADHLPAIRKAVWPDKPFGLGLRLSGVAADALVEPETLAGFKDFLAAQDSHVFTINAFPYGPFHGTRVKQDVYQPDWRSDERLRFTNLCADILAELLPDHCAMGSISTVPGTFKPLAGEPGAVDAMTERYARHAAHLALIEQRTGKYLTLAIEPEPCCFLETIEESIAFFRDHLFGEKAVAIVAEAIGMTPSSALRALKRHLGLCYDVCHAAVEFEDARASVEALTQAGVAITKLQLSSAMRVAKVDERTEMLLKPFDEGVYLHQTIEWNNGQLTRHTDLEEAFSALRAGKAGGEWRVHCHVPVFLADLGELGSTQAFLLEILDICRESCVSTHLEVETYTWDVLPDHLRGTNKAEAIARELTFILDRLG